MNQEGQIIYHLIDGFLSFWIALRRQFQEGLEVTRPVIAPRHIDRAHGWTNPATKVDHAITKLTGKASWAPVELAI